MKKMTRVMAWLLCFCLIVSNMTMMVSAEETNAGMPKTIEENAGGEPTQEPVVSPTQEPTVSPTQEATVSPEQTPEPDPIATPEVEPTQEPVPVESSEPEPTESAEPTESSEIPDETATPEETPSPENVVSPTPTASPDEMEQSEQNLTMSAVEGLVTVNYKEDLIAQVGSQGTNMCMAYTLAYCRTITDGKVHAGSEYWQDGTGGMPEWAGYYHSGSERKQSFLSIIKRQIDSGKPVGMYVTGHYRSNQAWNASGDHWVAVIGYKKSADADKLNTSDFYIIDPGNCGYDYLSENTDSFSYTTSNLLVYSGSVTDPGTTEDVVDSGTCGKNLKWSLSKEGTLEITGQGEMNDVNYYSPWYQYSTQIKKVVIGEGVTSIGAYAFYSHYTLKSVSISSTVKKIGKLAFYGSSQLDTIEGREEGLLRLPDTVERINDSFGYTGFSDVYLGGNLKAVGLSSFFGLNLNSITIAKDIGAFELQLYNNAYTTAAFTYDTLYIGKDVTAEWWKNKYACRDMNKDQIVQSYVSIPILEQYVQKNIIVDEQNQELLGRYGGLYLKNADGYTLSTFPKNASFNVFPSDITITAIGENAFANSKVFGKLTIPQSVTRIENGAFMNCTDLAEVVLPSGLQQLGQLAFGSCSSLKKINIPKSLENNIDYSAYNFKCFANTALTSISFEDGIEKIPAGLFHSCLLTSIKLPETLKIIDDNAFRYCTQLTSIDIPEGVEELGYYCFGDSGIKTAILPFSLREAKAAFVRCNLDELTVRTREFTVDDGYYGIKESIGNPGKMYGYKNSYAYELAQRNGIDYYDIETGEKLPVTDYIITYHMNGGINHPDNKVGYNAGETVVFKDPTKEGARFGGWTTSDNTQITEVSGKTIEVTAKWIDAEDFWVEDIPEQTYTGKAVKPDILVYSGSTLLRESIDYTVSYKNNTKASNTSNTKSAPTAIITAKGNYVGKDTITFEIEPKMISDTDILTENITLKYTGKTQKPVPEITYNGKKLKNNTDFTVEYTDSNSGAYKDAGSYQVKIKGKGNFTGERTVTCIITESSLMSKMTVSKISNQAYTGEEICPEITVKDGKEILSQGSDYTVAYKDNKEIGTATVVLTGQGSYAGVKRVTFKITGGAINKAKVSGIPKSLVYTGEEVTAKDSAWGDAPVLTMTVNKETKILTEGKDYEIEYQKNTDKGTATILFTGINGYTGTLKKTFKITAYDIGRDTEGAIVVSLAGPAAYAKGGSKPEPEVTFNGAVLKAGTDYTLSYKNNTKVNDGSDPKKIPTVTIKGKGNFSGSTTMTYAIVEQELSKMELSVPDKTYQNKKNAYQSAFKIADLDGKALKAGTDYEKKAVYTYKEAVELDDGTKRNAGEEVGTNDILPVGAKVTVTVTGKGNYKGTLTGDYRIVKADISKAAVKIPAQTYTGGEITPGKNDITVKVGGVQLAADDYEIVSYSNNTDKGTATMTIRGVGNYGGTKTIKFTIKAKSLLMWWRK